MLALVILHSLGPKESFIKVLVMCSLLGIYVNLSPPLGAAGGGKARDEFAGIVHYEFLGS